MYAAWHICQRPFGLDVRSSRPANSERAIVFSHIMAFADLNHSVEDEKKVFSLHECRELSAFEKSLCKMMAGYVMYCLISKKNIDSIHST